MTFEFTAIENDYAPAGGQVPAMAAGHGQMQIVGAQKTPRAYIGSMMRRSGAPFPQGSISGVAESTTSVGATIATCANTENQANITVDASSGFTVGQTYDLVRSGAIVSEDHEVDSLPDATHVTFTAAVSVQSGDTFVDADTGLVSHKVKLAFSFYDTRTQLPGNRSDPSALIDVKKAASAIAPWTAAIGYTAITITMNADDLEAAIYPELVGAFDSVQVWAQLHTSDSAAGAERLIDANWYLVQTFTAVASPGEYAVSRTISDAGATFYAQLDATALQSQGITHSNRYLRPLECLTVAFWKQCFFFGGSSSYSSEDDGVTAENTDTLDVGPYEDCTEVTITGYDGPIPQWWEGKRFQLEGSQQPYAFILRVTATNKFVCTSKMNAFEGKYFHIYGPGSQLLVGWPLQAAAECYQAQDLRQLVEPDDGGKITALKRCRGGLAVYKWGPAPKVFLLLAGGEIPFPTDSFQIFPIAEVVIRAQLIGSVAGAPCHWAVIMDDAENNYFFSGRLGFFFTNGSSLQNISSESIQEQLRREYDAAREHLAAGRWIDEDGVAEWTIPITGSTFRIYTFDPSRQAWTTRPISTKIRFGWRGLDSDGEEQYFYGLDNGRVAAQGGLLIAGAAQTAEYRQRLVLRDMAPIRLLRIVDLVIDSEATDWSLAVQFFINANVGGSTPDRTVTLNNAAMIRLKRRLSVPIAPLAPIYEAEVALVLTGPTSGDYCTLESISLEADA